MSKDDEVALDPGAHWVGPLREQLFWFVLRDEERRRGRAIGMKILLILAGLFLFFLGAVVEDWRQGSRVPEGYAVRFVPVE